MKEGRKNTCLHVTLIKADAAFQTLALLWWGLWWSLGPVGSACHDSLWSSPFRPVMWCQWHLPDFNLTFSVYTDVYLRGTRESSHVVGVSL